MSTISLSCPGCGKRYELSGSLAGKRARCKACSHEFSIPIPRQIAPSAAPSPPRPSRPSVPPPPVLDTFNPYGDLEEDAGRGAAVSYDDDETYLPPRAGGVRAEPAAKKKKKKNKSSSSSSFDDWWGMIPLGAAGLILLLTVCGFVMKSAAFPILGIIVLLGLLLSFVGGIWSIVTAFRESVACGLMFLFLPLYSLVYLITRWSEMRRPFTLNFVGALAFIAVPQVFIAGGLLPGFAPRPAQAGNGFAPINVGNPNVPHVGFQRHQPVDNPAPQPNFQPNQPGAVNNMPGFPQQNEIPGMNPMPGMPQQGQPGAMNNMPGPPPGFPQPGPGAMNNMPGPPNGFPRPVGMGPQMGPRFGRPGNTP